MMFTLIIYSNCFLTAVCTDGDVRIVDGSNEFRGRVETCINGQWGTICDDGWDNNDATVVCFQLGYSPIGESFH